MGHAVVYRVFGDGTGREEMLHVGEGLARGRVDPREDPFASYDNRFEGRRGVCADRAAAEELLGFGDYRDGWVRFRDGDSGGVKILAKYEFHC